MLRRQGYALRKKLNTLYTLHGEASLTCCGLILPSHGCLSREYSLKFAHLASCRFIHTSREPSDRVMMDENNNGDDGSEEDEDATLEEYEELLLHSSEAGVPGEYKGSLSDSESPQGDSPSASKLLENIYELLPIDGAGLRLTTITPLVDVESISELFGSVCEFVQLFPHRFRCYQAEESDGTRRWYVSRAQAVSLMKPVDITPSSLNECNFSHGDKVTYSKVKVKLHDVQSTPSMDTLRALLCQLQEFLLQKGPLATAGILHTLPLDLQNSVRSLGGGLLRLFKNPIAEEYVDLSADTTLVAARGVLSSQDVTTFHQQMHYIMERDTTLVPDAGYDTGSWDVELDLSDEPMHCPDEEASEVDGAEPDEDFLRGDGTATATVPHNTGSSTLTIPRAPPKPPERPEKRRTPPPVFRKKEEDLRKPKSTRLSEEELLRAHTDMALLRGRRAPGEMLELFVECVPTFPVPVQRVKVTDALARVLGPRNTMHKVIKIYSYYFDRDKTLDTVRLKPSVQHPRLGVADKLYADESDSEKGVGSTTTTFRKLQETNVTRAFPVLQTPIRGVSTDAPLSISKKGGTASLLTGGAISVTPTSVLPSPEWFALLDTIPFDHYISITQWSHGSAVSETAIRDFLKHSSNLHCFLTQGMGSQLWRLRPYWLAPGCTAELSTVDSDAAAFTARYLRPIWSPISRLLEKMSPLERDCLINASKSHSDLTSLFRSFGRFCWVDASGENLRKYTATPDLDDIDHVAIIYLHSILSFEFVKLQDILLASHTRSGNCDEKRNSVTQTTNEGVRKLLSHGLEVMKRSRAEKGSELHLHTQQEDVYPFLRRYNQKLEVKVVDDTPWVARRSLFRKENLEKV